MRIAFIGHGAIASLFMSNGVQNRYEFELITRTGQPCVLIVQKLGTSVIIAPEVNTIERISNVDLVLVCIKAFQIPDFLKQVAPYLSKNTTLVFINNGMGVDEILTQGIPHQPCIIGTTSYAAYKSSYYHCLQTGLGKTELGWVNGPENKVVKETLNQFTGNTYWHNDIKEKLWRKLAVNAVINPITAIQNGPNKIVLSPNNSQHIHNICNEVALLMNKDGYPISPQLLINEVISIAQKTANNFSSMQQDISNKRTTEINYINGYLCQIGKKYGIATPYNQYWRDAVMSQELAEIKKPEQN